MDSDFSFIVTNTEPAHVHVTKGNADGKIWLEPVPDIAYMHDFTNAERKNIMEIITSNYELLKVKWYEYFSK